MLLECLEGFQKKGEDHEKAVTDITDSRDKHSKASAGGIGLRSLNDSNKVGEQLGTSDEGLQRG